MEYGVRTMRSYIYKYSVHTLPIAGCLPTDQQQKSHLHTEG